MRGVIFLIVIALIAPLATRGDCQVGDIIYREGDSIGVIGFECIDDARYNGTESFCGSNDTIFVQEKVLTCSGMVPYCVQCGPPKRGAALCLSTREVPDYCDDSPPTPSPASMSGWISMGIASLTAAVSYALSFCF